PVTNGDLEVDKLLKEKIIQSTPSIPLISEETANLNNNEKYKNYWLIDPIDGTRDYIKKKDEYTLNAALIIDLTSFLSHPLSINILSISESLFTLSCSVILAIPSPLYLV
ncbi:MAG: inositol monophosphatase family protein, partial [Candidatus Pacearchaeota archaeon]|nr:inositol monophosphatase family protein [Candidatus Pacearchaeota archaeon]